MSTLSVVATAQSSNVPPRVKVDVTDTGSSPAITQVTVTRTDAAGNTSVVRTNDGNPLVLTTSGSNRVGTVFDYEMPYGVGVTYSTSEQPANKSSAVTVVTDSAWLVHPGVPARSMPVDFRINSFDDEDFDVNVGVFRPMGRANAVVVTDGRRQSGSSSFTVGTETLAELANLRALVADAGVLQLNVPSSLNLGIDTSYVFVMGVTVKRRSSIGTAPQRDVVMPYVTVDAPVGGSQAQYTWADVVAKYATWQDLINANATWAAVQTPTS